MNFRLKERKNILKNIRIRIQNIQKNKNDGKVSDRAVQSSNN